LKKRNLLNPKIDWELLKETYSEWRGHNASQWGAALAFYAIFSFSPILIIVVAIAGIVFGKEAVQIHILEKIRDLVGIDSTAPVKLIIENAYMPGSDVTATIVAVILILLGATSVLVMLRNVLDTMWGVTTDPNASLMRIIQARLISLGVVIIIGFILLLSMFVSIYITALSKYMGSLLQVPIFLLQLVNFMVSLGFVTLLCAIFYKFLPDVKISWRDVWTSIGSGDSY